MRNADSLRPAARWWQQALAFLGTALLCCGSSITQAPVFVVNGSTNNTVMSVGAQGLDYPAGSPCDLKTEFQAGQSSSNYGTVGLFGCVVVLSGSTQYQASGVFGAAQNASVNTNAVAGYFSARAVADGTGASLAQRVRNWAINPWLGDGGHTHVLLQNEVDFNVSGSDTTVEGMIFTGASTASANSSSHYINFLPLDGSGGTHNVPIDLICSPGSSSSACIYIGPAASGSNQASQKLFWYSASAGGGGAADTSVDFYVGPAGVLTEEASLYGGFSFNSIAFSNLGTPRDGTVVYCSDCGFLTTPGTCAGSGNGALAIRLNATWRCL